MKLLPGLLAAAAIFLSGGVRAETIAITGARILTMGPKGEIPLGTVIVRDGKITAVGADVTVPPGARIIQGQGRILAPGFMMANSVVSVTDFPGYGTMDDASTASSKLSAGNDLQYAVNPQSVDIAAARAEGVTHAVVTPQRGGGAGREDALFDGQAAVIGMADDGGDILVKPKAAMIAESGRAGAGAVGGGRGAAFVILRELLDNARAYAKSPLAYNEAKMRDLGLSRPDLKALVPVVEGKTLLIINAGRAPDILQLIALAREEKIHIAVQGGQEAWIVAKPLAAAKIPVIVYASGGIPEGWESFGATERNATRLVAAGVKVVFQSEQARPSYLIRSPRIAVGLLVGRDGLPRQAALEALTRTPAEVFGLADRFGSIETGKSADMVLWSGDPLDTSSYVEAAFVDGREQSLKTREALMGERYLKQYLETGVITPRK